jgi:hypothetical protein
MRSTWPPANGARRLVPGQRVIFNSGIALAAAQIKNIQITQPDGRAILALRVRSPGGQGR